MRAHSKAASMAISSDIHLETLLMRRLFSFVAIFQDFCW
jgi:hypothetical protein